MSSPLNPTPGKNPNTFKSIFWESVRDTPRIFLGELLQHLIFFLYWVLVIGIPGLLGFWLFDGLGFFIGALLGAFAGVIVLVVFASGSLIKFLKERKSKKAKF